MARLGLVTFLLFASAISYSAPHPSSIFVSGPLMSFNYARVTIQPMDKQICQVRWNQKGQSPHISPFLPCPDVYAYVAQKLKELSDPQTLLQVTLKAPENFPLNILVQNGQIRSLRQSTMQDSFKVVKGSIDFQDHPDSFDATQDRLNQTLDLPKALEELRSALSKPKP